MINEIRFEIGCKNLDEQVDFYENVLGGEIISKDEGFIVLKIAGIRFALWDAKDNEKAQKVGITLVTKESDAIKAKLRDNRSIVNEWEDCPMFMTVDPDGNGITIMDDEN